MKRALTVLAALALLAGCSSSGDPAPTSPSATTVTPTPSPTPSPTPTGDPVWPLTGLPAPTHDLPPVVGVKVENSIHARPQTGLEHADIVFVEMVEGGTTRFHAVYNTTFPDVVGPVRSVRPMDAAILGQWDGTLVYSGGQPQFVQRVRDTGLLLVEDDADDPSFFRSRERPAPHNLYTELPVVLDLIDDVHDDPPTPMFAYGEASSAAGGPTVAWVRAEYPSVRSGWEWDADAGAWERYDNGVANWSTELVPVTATNVLVLRVEIRDTGATDSANQWVPETVLTGEGDLVLFSEGATVEGTWRKGGDTDPFEFVDASGGPLLLAPGTTWVELLPTTDATLTFGAG